MQSHIQLTAIRPTRRFDRPKLFCLGLIVLADPLLYGRAPGLNLYLYALSIAVASVLCRADLRRPRLSIAFVGLTAIASLPLLEAPTMAAIAVSIAAVICTCLAAARLTPANAVDLPSVLLRFVVAVPRRLFQEIPKQVLPRIDRQSAMPIGKHLAAWILPMTFATGFLLLFREANPVVEAALHNIDLSLLLQLPDAWRVAFWLAVGACAAVLMQPRLARKRPVRAGDGRNRLIETLFDHQALVRSLALFNALFAAQSAMDILYLWGSMALPSGMSHAEYAHRGAYPLVATALLAAAFVLIAMRRGGPGDRSLLIRSLVLIWIGQNVLLCGSSILRLELYVEAYSLTRFRVAAGVWMGLVASGLLLMFLRILLRRSNRWLIAMNLLALTSVVYAGALIDIPAFVARFNVDHCAELDHTGVLLDIPYMQSLGPSVIPALDAYLTALPNDKYDQRELASRIRTQLATEFLTRGDDWRSWSYRAVRLARYLSSTSPFAS